MLWLTGGALTICVGMVIGLLALVIYCGAITFWPLPLVQLETVDGSIRLGEVTRRETFALSESAIANFTAPVKEQAERVLDGQPSVRTTRRLLRTGNFKLTGEHFNWVSDFEVAPGGESVPTWALTVERLTWGRFFGTPQQFNLRHSRPTDPAEASLDSVLSFFAANRWRLPAEEGEALDAALADLKEKHARLRAANVEQFLGRFQANEQRQLLGVLGDGTSQALSELTAVQGATDVDVTGVVERWTGPEASWSQFSQHHNAARSRYHRRRKLEKHDIGSLSDRKIETARLRLKQAELDHDVEAVDATQELVSLDLEIEGIEDARESSRAMVEQVRSEYRDNGALVAAGEKILQMIEEDIRKQLETPQSRAASLQQEIGELPPAVQERVAEYREVRGSERKRAEGIKEEINELNDENSRYSIVLVTADGQEVPHELSEIVRAYPANQLGWGQKASVYASRWYEFLMDDPRSANQEGGVFPAIWGTVAMTVIMSLFVVPFGVLASLYLREYAKGGLLISAVRIAINNLAGVPSIVFGVFGLGFFCYTFGAFIDGGPERAGITPWPAPMWFLVLTVLVVIAVAAFLLSIFSLSAKQAVAPRWKQIASRGATCLWLIASVMVVALIVLTPFFDGFYEAHEHNPKFGKGGLLWASLTLALLTLPVVIVSTEEALSAVPNSLREGSYACGAGKWQTIARIVLPHAVPGIMTGMILAMARGAGEVAPLMLVGALKYVPELPVDGLFPYVHPDRSFMHLGFHIYDVGFQSQDSEGAKPMVYTTTLLLIGLIATLNISAVALRSRLKKRFRSGQF